MTRIDHSVFCGCKNLQSITIPDSVTSIGGSAFLYCDQLKKYVLAPTSQNEEQCQLILNTFNTTSLADAFFTGNLETNPIFEKLLKSKITVKKFREVYIPYLIEKNEVDIFISLLSLVKKMSPEEIDGYMDLSVEKGMVEITSRLIAYRQKLYPPEKIEEMREVEFEKAIGIREKALADYRKEFKIVKENGVYMITGYKGDDTIVVIPGNIKGNPVQFRGDVFHKNANIQSVFIEDGVTEIPHIAFEGCSSLTKIEIPASVTKIADTAFHGRQKLITISAPEGSYAQTYAKKYDIKFQAI
jgi:hypothetical protein